jgi:hypothetical protein
MKFNVRKRVLVLVAVAAVMIGFTATTATGKADRRPTAAATTSAPRHPAVVRHQVRLTVRVATSRSTQRAAVSAVAAAPEPASQATIYVSAVTNPSTAQAAANACRGPIEILWPGLPAPIAQHDYCGGAWFNSVTTGERIKVVGGTMPGMYVANGRRLMVGKGTSSSVLSGLGTLVLQTCVGNQMVLVGLDRA